MSILSPPSNPSAPGHPGNPSAPGHPGKPSNLCGKNPCGGVPQNCHTKDFDGHVVRGLSCDGGVTCDAYATGNHCYSQCVDFQWDCHAYSFPSNAG